MKIVKGNLWNSNDNLILVSTNSTLKKNGELVMGRGAAKEARDLKVGLPRMFGYQIQEQCGSGGRYGIILARRFTSSPDNNMEIAEINGKYYGAFQVKYHWKDKADLELIYFSTQVLDKLMRVHFNLKCSMNFPGIGNGQLTYDEVYPIIEQLPDNVTVYMKE